MIRVLAVASEIFPLIKTGGLADVTGALPAALAPHDVKVHTLVPGYPAILQHLENPSLVRAETAYFGGSATILHGVAGGLDLYVLDAPHLFDRPGNPYTAPDGADWPDNAQRFAALAHAGFLLATSGRADLRPDLVHVHDWQAALLPAYLHYAGSAVPSVMTIHNIAFQGVARASLLETLRLPAGSFAIDGVEYFGSIGILKAGLQFASRITTVSPTYAAEICTPEFGMGLDGLLRMRASILSGIANGIDTTVWNPAADPALPASFTAQNLAPKRQAKAALQSRFNLKRDPQAPLFGVVSRLSHQKGLDVLLDCLAALTGAGAQLALIGAGDEALQMGYTRAANANPGQIGVRLGYDEATAHLIQGGADAILVPSRFEPCGLTQLCALRYGSIPVVSRVGGLNDTVIDANVAALAAKVATGIQFSPVTAQGLTTAMARTLALFRQPAIWRMLQENAMRCDVSWAEPAKAYARLYRDLVQL
jgi:starch synthase